MTAGLTDAQINDIYKGIDPVVVHNKAARMGMCSDYAMRIAFGRAIESAIDAGEPVETMVDKLQRLQGESVKRMVDIFPRTPVSYDNTI